MQPASVTKVLTTAAALLGLGPRCTAHHDGGGIRPDDPGWWCSRAAVTRRCRPHRRARTPGTTDAARISDLADQVRRSGTTVTAVQVDISAYSGPTMAPGWDPARHRRRRYRADGSGDARRRSHPAGQRRIAPVHDTRARRRSRAGRRAARRPGHRHGAARRRSTATRSRRCSRRRCSSGCAR